MAYLDTNARTVKAVTSGIGRQPILHGVFTGLVKNAEDVQRNGRLQVWIPEFGSAPEEKAGWITVSYCSPFAGATNVDSISKTDKQSFEGTQTSYGMWMVPPDINNEVIVMFVGGDSSKGIWIGSLYNQFMNNMVPGMAADAKNWQYPGVPVPVAEYNKWDTSVTQPDRAIHPYQRTKFKGIGNQGLIKDQSRGLTSSSARRESPSSVFGIITPGPVIKDNIPSAQIRRKGGSSFIMDDGTGTEYVQLTTKSGAQVKIDETNGFIYLINRDGTSWIQMDQTGNIDIFGAGDISLRAQRDLNIRADRNVNIEAGQSIYMKAAKDTTETVTPFTYDVNNIPKPASVPYWKYVGEGKGTGGNIVMQALNNMHTTVKSDAYITVLENNLSTVVGNALTVTTIAGGQDYNSKAGIKLTTGASLDLVATANIRVGSTGTISVSSKQAVNICANDKLSLNGDIGVAISSISQIGITGNTLFSEHVGVVGVLDVAGGSNLGNTVNLGGSVSVPTPILPGSPDPAQSAQAGTQAEVKAMIEKINILATWKSSVTHTPWKANTAYAVGVIVSYNGVDYMSRVAIPASATFNKTMWIVFTPEDKFHRNAESLSTIITRLPTYEPCPEHEQFSYRLISGYTPVQTQGDITYEGSAGAGNSATVSPVKNTTPGANNTGIPAPAPADSAVSKDFNMAAYQCQLKIHEGVKYVSYLDSKSLPTAGIGHLLRTNEISAYPIPSPVSEAQVLTWFNQDAPTSIKGAQELLTIDVWGNLSDIRKRACADLCYNLGKTRLSKFVKFIAAMKVENYQAAGTALQDSAWYGQVGRRGPNIIAMIVQNIDPNGCDKKFPV